MTESHTPRARKSLSIWLWLMIALSGYILFVVVRLFGLFQTGPAIEIGPETTVLTEPVREDGSIDYVAALDAEFSKGVTHENNAAVLLVQALGAEIFDSDVRQQSLEKLGFKQEKSIDHPFVAEDQFFSEREADLELADLAIKPWARAEQPLMDEWLLANQDALDVIVLASQRPRFYTPFVRSKPNSSLIECLLPLEQASRSVTRALAKRAMLHISEDKIDAAFADALTIFRLSRLLGEHPTTIGRLVAFAHNAVATECLAQIIQSGKATHTQIDQFSDDFSALNSIEPMYETTNRAERFVGLEMSQSLALMRMPQGVQVPAFALRTIDANVMMRVINEAYDELVAAMKLEDHGDRVEELARLEQAWTNKASRTSMLSLMLGSRSAVSTSIANLLASITLPASSSIVEAEARMQLKNSMAEVLIALGKYRAETGEFPDNIDQLAPQYLKAVPDDPRSGEPIQYERTSDGTFQLIGAGADDESDDVVLPDPDEN